ncbi:MAG: hypothetical protein AAFO94_08075, partial [Bacteroidota bacterium]
FFLPRVGYAASAWAALACYSFMALAGYWLGRKYFPIPYRIFNMLGYVALALFIFFISRQINDAFQIVLWQSILINTGLMLLFLGLLYLWERKTILGFLGKS